MSGLFSKKNTLELEKMFQVLNSSDSGLKNESLEFEVRFGSYTTNKFVTGISEVGIKKLIDAQELYSSGPVYETTLNMMATNSFDTPRKIVYLHPDTGVVLKTEYQKKENINNIYSTKNNMKISLSKEIMSKSDNDLNQKYDLFRLKRRESYISKNKLWRYDFTKVYQLNTVVSNPMVIKTWLTDILANSESQKYTYEFELEHIPSSRKLTPTLLQESFTNELVSINKILNFSIDTGNESLKEDIFSKLKLLLPSRLRNKNIESITVKGGIAKSTGTVSYSNLALLLNGKYAVTEKIDGTRVLIFISDSKMYSIDLKNEVNLLPIELDSIESVCKKNLNNTLLDCEYIAAKDTYAVFDILVDGGINVTMDKNLKDRYNRLNELSCVFEKLSKKFFIKKYYFPQSKIEFQQAVKKVHEAKYDYELDGIIFTPMEDSYYSGTSLKWKPNQLNTIDFLVRIVNTNKGDKTITLNLYVGISIRDFIAKRMKRQDNYFEIFPQYTEKSYYFPILFQPIQCFDADPSLIHQAVLKYDNLDSDIYYVNGITIRDNTVIEMGYHNKKWVPLKYRDDKTSVYQRQGGDAGNYWYIAYNVWENICNPVTIDVLTGKEVVTDKYFKKVSSDQIGMVKYHNFIKLCYYKKYTKNHNTWIMELGAGRGNDINKHLRIEIKNALLVDIDQKALDEGKVRIEALDPRERTTNFHMLNADIGKNISDKLDKEGYKQGQFDVIVCNFAIHYVFGTHDAIQNVREYTSKYLKRGGILMFSTFDGKKVFDFLIQNKVGTGEEYKFFNNENLLFVIKRLFKSNTFANYGQEVAIYIDRIGSYMNEYLVNLEYVINEFTKGGEFKLIENTNFSKWYPIYAKKMKNNPKTKLSDAECQFSFFYNYVVLQKK